jgi:hypothetical protein
MLMEVMSEEVVLAETGGAEVDFGRWVQPLCIPYVSYRSGVLQTVTAYMFTKGLGPDVATLKLKNRVTLASTSMA